MDGAAAERLRQERETFDLAKRHADRWFGLRLGMGYAGIVLMETVVAVCIWVILNPTSTVQQASIGPWASCASMSWAK